MAKAHGLSGGDVVGQAVNIALDSVEANPWNPNRMTAEVRESLKHGLQSDGWLASQALLVWATDETGASKMLIIDGEHRWTAARELGFKKGPAVLLSGITEAKAKSLTVAMNHRRGKSEEGKLRDLLASIQPDFGETLALDVGVSDAALMKLLATQPGEFEVETKPADTRPASTPEPAPESGEQESEPTAAPRMVQLFVPAEVADQFTRDVEAIARRYGTDNFTATVVAAVTEAALLHAAGAEVMADEDEG